VLINLLSNAIKFTPAEGTIKVGLAEQDRIAILTVRDTGGGIDPAVLPQLFTMFFQSDELVKTVNTGLGVGLALAKALVEMHGGVIEAYSAGKNQGAHFTVRLPLIAGASAAEPPAPARKVLVVDDNPDHLELLADLLKLRGYEVIEAHDATEALRRIAEQQPDACVIDIGLPGMDGYELARKLREIPEVRAAKLIAVTGYGTTADRSMFQEAGFDHYFPKPPDIEALHRVLSAMGSPPLRQ
jgi:CheY-like chemotaxis protein